LKRGDQGRDGLLVVCGERNPRGGRSCLQFSDLLLKQQRDFSAPRGEEQAQFLADDVRSGWVTDLGLQAGPLGAQAVQGRLERGIGLCDGHGSAGQDAKKNGS
jgi:hypothetical protein